MGTLLASTSQAAAASTTSSVFEWDNGDILNVKAVNATPATTEPTLVMLQGSLDNVTWYNIDRRTFGMADGGTYFHGFELSNYMGTNGGGGWTPQSMYGLTSQWAYYRLQFTGNQTNAVTISATNNTKRTKIIPFTGVPATAGGAVGSWAPPQGAPIHITRAVVVTTTFSTGAANLSVGVAANKTTSATNLIPATAVGTAIKDIDSITTQIIAATAAESGISNLVVALTGTQAVTITGSADTTGLVGFLVLDYIQP